MNNVSDIDLVTEHCENEPIHIPGAIQPFGILLTVTRDGLIIENASTSCHEFWGVDPSQLVGQSFREKMLATEITSLEEYLNQPALKECEPLVLQLPWKEENDLISWELHAHEYQGVIYLELEPLLAQSHVLSSIPFHRRIRNSVQTLQRAKSLQELCDNAVREVRALTGFDRVMLYRFDPDWHGVVISEARSETIGSYLGHHFPASDIPPQARAIFLENWVRMIPDVNYIPSAITPGRHPVIGEPLDLSLSTLRSVSPIHLQYLRNMNVQATLTVSLVDEDKLWGLIACHHEMPLLIDSESRLGAQLIGQLVSSQIRVKESLDDLEYRARLKQVHSTLIEHMQREADVVQGLTKYSPNMLDMAASSGAAAAICHDGDWTLIGKTPSVEQINDLVSWLTETHPGENLFQTDSLSRCYPKAIEYKEVGSGLLAISIPKTERSYILWFRPEVITTVMWAGNPDKSFKADDTGKGLRPRDSFQSWKEIVDGKAAPWKKVEIEEVLELRDSIMALDLKQQFIKEQQARARAERLGREKEDMVMVVSHDLRTPLSVAKISFDLLQHSGLNDQEQSQAWIARGSRATDTMEKLIVDVLDIAKIESGTLDLAPQIADVNDLINETVDMATPIAKVKNIQVEVQPKNSNCKAYMEKSRILQVLSNLVGNAIKFTEPGGTITLAVDQCHEDVVFRVSDTGRGISPENLHKIFDRFWQEKQSNRYGTGLGLSIAKGIVEKHNGKIWVESELNVGTSFYFSLPRVSVEKSGGQE